MQKGPKRDCVNGFTISVGGGANLLLGGLIIYGGGGGGGLGNNAHYDTNYFHDHTKQY